VIAASTESVRAFAFDRAPDAVAAVLRTSIEIVAESGGISTVPSPVIESVDWVAAGGGAGAGAGAGTVDGGGVAGVTIAGGLTVVAGAAGCEKAAAPGAPAAHSAAIKTPVAGTTERLRIGRRRRSFMALSRLGG
jgi:hypothetical protein